MTRTAVRYPARHQKQRMNFGSCVNQFAAIVVMASLLLAVIACGPSESATPTQADEETDSPLPTLTPTPTTQAPGQLPDSSTWVLDSLDGHPLIEGTYAWIRFDRDTYGGFDGCNMFGGRTDSGTPVAGNDGSFTTPSATESTLIGCESPEGILDQSDNYLNLLRQGERFIVENDRLEILDGAGDVRLAFLRKPPLPGQPIPLAGTAWQLVAEDDASEDVKAATLVFLDGQLAAGDTACRGYVAAYRASRGGLAFPSRGMTEYNAECSQEMWEQEGRFGDDLSQVMEYAVNDEEGTLRLRIWTSRGRTVTFVPLVAENGNVLGVEWKLTAFAAAGELYSPDSNTRPQRLESVIPETEVTLRFGEDGVSGSAGCNSYDSQPGTGGFRVSENGSIEIADEVVQTQQLCGDPPGRMAQEERFLDLLPSFQEFRVFGEQLFIQAEEGDYLIFQQAR